MPSSILKNRQEKKKKKKNKGGILGGIGYVAGKAITGALDVVEDTADVLIGGTADLLGFEEFAKKVHTDDYTDKWNYSLDEWYNPNGIVKTIGDIGSGIGQSATYLGLNFIPVAGPAISKVAMAGSGVGSGIQSAVEKTGKLGAKEYIYGGLSGVTEVALESFSGAAGKAASKLVKPAAKGVSKSVAKTIGKESAEALAKKGAKSAAKTVGRKGLIRTTLLGMAGEAFEEGASEYLNAKYQNWTGVDKDAKATVKDVLYSAFVGAMSGGALTAGSQGFKNASNLRKGTRIVEKGNAEAAINTAKHFSKTLNLKAETSGANAERIRGQYAELLQQIDKAVDAYEKLPDADKEGTRAKLYLGEIQETVAYVNMAAKSSEAAIAYRLVLESKPEEAERYAKIVSTVTGKTVTADDIRNNTPMFGKIGAMDMLGAIKYAGEVAADAENTLAETERLNELKNQAIEEANVGTDMEGAPLQTSPEVQTATPTMKSTLFAKNPTLNAQVNPSVAPDASVNTAETAQISTEAQAVAENANVQATTAETKNAGLESMQTEKDTAQNEKASANTEVKRDISDKKTKSKPLSSKKSTAEYLKDNILYFDYLPKKVRDTIISRIQNVKGALKTEAHIRKEARNLSEEIMSAMETNTKPSNDPSLQDAYALVSYAKKYLNKIAFSKSDLSEIRNKFDKDASRFINRWQARRDKGVSVSPDAFVTSFAREVSGMESIEKMNYMDALFAIDEYYNATKDILKSKRVPIDESASNEEREYARKNIEDSVYRALAESKSVRDTSDAESAFEAQRKEAFDALLKEENAKEAKKAEQKQKAKTAEQIQAEKEATKQAHWDAYTKARDEATLALGVDGFALMSAEARDRVTRMYMEFSGVKGVTAETKKALASILAVRPGLYVFTTDKLADNGAWWYNKATGGRAIVINKNSGAITNTILHEITHDLAKENSVQYEALAKSVLANTSDEDKQKVYDAYLMRHLRDYNQIDESATLEEAKAVFKTFSKEQQKHFDDMVKEEIVTRAVAEKLGQKNFLHEHGKEHRFAIMRAIAHLQKLGSSLVHRSAADKYVREIEKNFKAAAFKDKSQAERYIKMLGEWEEEELRRDLSEIEKEFQKDYEDDVDAVLNGTYQSDNPLLMGRTPEALTKIGINQLPLAITPSHVYSIAKTEAEAKKENRYQNNKNYHGLGADAVKQIREKLSSPIMIIAHHEFTESQKAKHLLSHRAIALVDLEIDGKQIICPIEIDAAVQNNQTFIDANLVATYFGRGKVNELVRESIAKENIGEVGIYYADTKKATALLQNSGEQFPQHLASSADASGIIIRHVEANVNRRIDHFTKSQQFTRWFGDWQNDPEKASKIVNKDGTPKIMYHGSPAQFSAFDKKKAKSSGLYGRGFYFTDSDSHAKTYGNTYAVYLDVKTPLSEGSATVTTKQIRKYLEAVAENEDYSIENYGTYDIDEILKKITARDAFAVLTDINATAIGDLVEATKLWNKVNGTKFDGIVVPTETVVFEPTQIKSATDNIGTFSRTNSNIYRSIDISDRIITTQDDRTTVEKAKDFAKEVKSRGVKGNAKQAKSKGEEAFIKAQIHFTNAQAGIEHFLKQEGLSQLEVEASVNMVRMAGRKGMAAISGKQTDINGNIIGDGFNDIMRPINKSNREDFKYYWVHKLNTYRAQRGKAIFKDVTAEESAQEVKRLEKLHPEFKDVLEKLNEFDKNALQLAVDARLISQEQADAYHKLNPYYFPTIRVKDADPKKFKSGAFRFKNLNKQAQGGEADIVDPIEAYMDHIVTLERSAYINILANAIYDNENGVDVVSARERIPNFDKKLNDEGREGLIGMNYKEGIEPKSNTVVFFRDGEALAMNVSNDIMDGFRALQGGQESFLDFKLNTAAIKLFSKLVTTYNPFFIIRNAVRDFQDAGIYSRFGIRKFAKTYFTTALHQIMTNGKYWQEYIANGGFDTSMFDYSLGTESNRIGLKKAKGNPLKQAATLFENTQIFIEQLPRFTEFLLSRQAGNDMKTSLYFAADVTVNFGRSGKTTKVLGRTLIPFLNPSVQGFSKNVRHFKDATNFKDYERWKKSAKSFLISAAALGIAPILLSNLMYEDDEEYQNLNDNIKTNYYLIRYGEGKYIRVPRGRLSSAFASVTNTTQSQVKSKKVDARQWMDTFENVMSNTTPFETATRTIFSPITDAKTNTTWYGGEIESQAYDHVAPAQRYDEYTSGIAKWLGKTFNDSPKKIDYVLDQYSGVIGDILLPLTADKRKSDNVVETLFSSMVTDATYSNKLSKEFYEIYDEVDFAEETMDNVLVKKHLEKVKTAVRDLNKDIDKINADSSLSDEEKVKRAKEIRVLINRAYKTAIEDYDIIKQKSKNVTSAYENVFTTAEVTKTNYKALGLDKDDIGTYAIVYSVGDESYAAQTRDTIDEAQEYLEGAMERAAYADLVLNAYGAEAAMKAYSSSFYEKATVANALGADYENMYRLLLETRYMGNAEKKERVDEYLRSMPYPTNVKYLIKYIFGDTTKKTKKRAALALKNANIDEETKKEWLKKLK